MSRQRLYTLLVGVVVAAAAAFYLTLPRSSDAKHAHASHSASGASAREGVASRSGSEKPSSSFIGRILRGGDDDSSHHDDDQSTDVEMRQVRRGTSHDEGASSRAERASSPLGWLGRLFGGGRPDGDGTGSTDRAQSGAPFWGGPSANELGDAPRSGSGSPGRAPDPAVARWKSAEPGNPGSTDPGGAALGGGSRLYTSTAGGADPATDTGPGTSPCTTGTTSGARCLACERANCPHDPRYRPYCEDFADAGDQSRCQAVLDCIRQSNCIATGAVSCYCGRDENIVTCTGTPPSTKGGGPGAHGDCTSEILFAFPPGSDSKFVVSHLVDVTMPGGAALSQGQCDYTSCGDVTATNECVPYCKE